MSNSISAHNGKILREIFFNGNHDSRYKIQKSGSSIDLTLPLTKVGKIPDKITTSPFYQVNLGAVIVDSARRLGPENLEPILVQKITQGRKTIDMGDSKFPEELDNFLVVVEELNDEIRRVRGLTEEDELPSLASLANNRPHITIKDLRAFKGYADIADGLGLDAEELVDLVNQSGKSLKELAQELGLQ